jgi:hypothetical protein
VKFKLSSLCLGQAPLSVATTYIMERRATSTQYSNEA